VTLGQIFSEYFNFHIHHHLSSRAGTVGQLVADVPSGLSLTPPKETRLDVESWIHGPPPPPLRRPIYLRWIVSWEDIWRRTICDMVARFQAIVTMADASRLPWNERKPVRTQTVNYVETIVRSLDILCHLTATLILKTTHRWTMMFSIFDLVFVTKAHTMAAYSVNFASSCTAWNVLINIEHVFTAVFIVLHYCPPFATRYTRTVFCLPIATWIIFLTFNPAQESALREPARGVKLSRCLITHRAMKTYGQKKIYSSYMLNLGTRLRWVGSIKLRPLYPQGLTLYRRTSGLKSHSGCCGEQ
jgi:hypothetical protein